MRVIGTAGHVDHGKSTLVEALTGINPDRLKEEQIREMTIDLGFAWLTLPDGEDVGIVDVPGHRDFIENMLAGVGGIDAALFVVAADEGVMPQTREHLSILNILQIQGGVVALTKTDLVDEEWLELVEEDLRIYLSSSVLSDAPIIRVSGKTHAGLPDLLEAIGDCLVQRPSRPDLHRPRLPVDRVFTISGFGTIVTGTLSDGCFSVGDDIEVLPDGMRARIRGLESHKRKSSTAVPGSRTAINIAGISVDEIHRGDVIAHPNSYRPTQRLDVSFQLLPEASQPLRHNTEVKFFIGSSEVVTRVRLLGERELLQGMEGYLQLEPKSPVVALRGDRYILRRPSPGETLGGGTILDPHPSGRHKRYSPSTLQRFSAIAEGSSKDVIIQTLISIGPSSMQDISDHTSINPDEVMSAVTDLQKSEEIIVVANRPPQTKFISKEIKKTVQPIKDTDILITSADWFNLHSTIIEIVDDFHRSYPLQRGVPREELKSRLIAARKLSAESFDIFLRKTLETGELAELGPIIFRPSHEIVFSDEQQRNIDDLLIRFHKNPYSPPSVKECQTHLGDDVFRALIDLGHFIVVSNDVVFLKEDFDRMVQEPIKLFAKTDKLTAAEVRDHFRTSRKYALAFLEYLDSIEITIREGDMRRLR